MKWMIALLLALFLVSGQGALAGATFYKWKDANGQWHYGDRTPDGVDAQTGHVETREPAPPSATSTNQPTAPAEKSKATRRNHKVVMYSASWCGHCKEARAFMQRKRIPFTEYDVEKSAKGKRDYKRLGGGGVPIIIYGPRMMHGFSEASFVRLVTE